MKRKRGNTINGWINLHKPLGITSSDAVNKVKWLLKPQKIGHAGTLDPLATGVLPLALGEGTKCINLLMDAKKTYEFTVTFGERRSTDDAEGEVVATSDHIPDAAAIASVLPAFTGPVMQLPPAYSALKIDGKRAYDLARAGEAVVLAPRPVTIYALELIGYELNANAQEASSPCGRRLEEGATKLRTHIPLAQENQIQANAKKLRRDMTDVEKTLWHYLRNKEMGGTRFRRQQPIDQYIVDFVCFEKRLIIELDGGQHAMETDAERTAYLESQGFKLLRFWNHEVMENIEGVWAVIAEQLGALSDAPPPNPPPQGGRALSRAHFRATVSKGTYIRSLGRDIALKLGSEGYISRLHRAAVGPFTDRDAISLDFLVESLHKAPPFEGLPLGVIPLRAALDDIPALALEERQLTQLRHGQRVTLTQPFPDTLQIAVLDQGELAALARVEGNQVIPVRLLNL